MGPRIVSPLRAFRLAFAGYRRTLDGIRRRRRVFSHGRSLAIVHDNTGKIRKDAVLLVACLRDEGARMPYFLDYYRRIGVDHFLFVDNDSTDGFSDWVARHDDCSVWRAGASYLESDFGMQWCNYLLWRYGSGHLCVTVDPDEFLVYPHIETRSLRDLGQFLKDDEREAMHVVMLDAYGDRPLRETIYQAGDDPFQLCPYIDRDGYIQRPGYGGGTLVQGGPRMRAHYRPTPETAPAINKIPVVWWRSAFAYRSATHDLIPVRLNQPHNRREISITGCLFRFKFTAAPTEKAAEGAVRKQQGGRDYRQNRDGADETFFEEGISVRYESPRQLVELGLMCAGQWA